jgi:hypothetical protein
MFVCSMRLLPCGMLAAQSTALQYVPYCNVEVDPVPPSLLASSTDVDANLVVTLNLWGREYIFSEGCIHFRRETIRMLFTLLSLP